jgi:hypothetical protein
MDPIFPLPSQLGQGLSPTTKKPLPWHLSHRFILGSDASLEFSYFAGLWAAQPVHRPD